MYAIFKCINGAFSVHSETSDLNAAKTQFHGLCQALWNAPDVLRAKVMIVDESLNCKDGYTEFVYHDLQPEPEPEADTGNE